MNKQEIKETLQRLQHNEVLPKSHLIETLEFMYDKLFTLPYIEAVDGVTDSQTIINTFSDFVQNYGTQFLKKPEDTMMSDCYAMLTQTLDLLVTLNDQSNLPMGEDVDTLIADVKQWVDNVEMKHDVNGDICVELIRQMQYLTKENQNLKEAGAGKTLELATTEKFYSETHGMWFDDMQAELTYALGYQQHELNEVKARSKKEFDMYNAKLGRLSEGIEHLIGIATNIVPELQSIKDETADLQEEPINPIDA